MSVNGKLTVMDTGPGHRYPGLLLNTTAIIRLMNEPANSIESRVLFGPCLQLEKRNFNQSEDKREVKLHIV